MSQTEPSKVNHLLSLAGIIGTILVFAVILYVAYLPGRPPAVDYQTAEKRKQTADETRAAGLAKITGYEIIDAEAGLVSIPIEEAMNSTVKAYQVSESGKKVELKMGN
jgi:hypothetical protein